MNATNPSAVFSVAQTNAAGSQGHLTVIARIYEHYGHNSSLGTRLLLIILLALVLHIGLKGIKVITEWIISKSHGQKTPFDFVTRQPKFITLIQLISNCFTFALYFFALGLILQEFGADLTTYLASASIVALAVSFGSQNLVQDVIISLTLIFSDAMDSGDMVEIAGTVTVVGRVEEMGLRFTTLRNIFNQIVFIPNRTIANVSRFPHGGVYAYADVQIPPGADKVKATRGIEDIAEGMWAQFGAIILEEPTIAPVQLAHGGGWEYVRVQFKIWPGQGSLIETTFRQQATRLMKDYDPNYADWQVAVTYRAGTSVKKL